MVARQQPDMNAALALAVPLFVLGLGAGGVITPNQTLTLVDVDPVTGGTAGGVLQTSQRIGAAIGQAVVGAAFFAALPVGADALTGSARSAAYGDALGHADHGGAGVRRGGARRRDHRPGARRAGVVRTPRTSATTTVHRTTRRSRTRRPRRPRLSEVLIDLHTHSRASDGTQTPAEVMRSAAAAGLDVVGLTDHDSAAGWDEAAARRTRRGRRRSCRAWRSRPSSTAPASTCSPTCPTRPTRALVDRADQDPGRAHRAAGRDDRAAARRRRRHHRGGGARRRSAAPRRSVGRTSPTCSSPRVSWPTAPRRSPQWLELGQARVRRRGMPPGPTR